MLAKIKDAGEMLWLSLDAQERQYLLYVLGYSGLFLWTSFMRGARLQRERREFERMDVMARLIAKQLTGGAVTVAD